MSLVVGWKVVLVNRFVLVVEDCKLSFVEELVVAGEWVVAVAVCSYCLRRDYTIAALVVDLYLLEKK